jgi:acyl carrier protein
MIPDDSRFGRRLPEHRRTRSTTSGSENRHDRGHQGGIVKEYILNEFFPEKVPIRVDDKTPLITGGVLDSIATIKLIAFLEERNGVQIEPHEMNPELTRLSARHRGARRSKARHG